MLTRRRFFGIILVKKRNLYSFKIKMMEDTMGKTRKDFSRAKMKEIMEDYAISAYYQNGPDYAEQNDCSDDVFYGIMEEVILKWIIWDEKVIKKIIQKACDNAYYHGGIGGYRKAKEHLQKCIQGRNGFRFNKKETKTYAEAFARSLLTMEEFANQNAMPVWLLDQTLQIAEDEGLVKKDTSIALKTKRLQFQTRKKEAQMSTVNKVRAKQYEGVQLKLEFYESQRRNNKE